MHRAILMGWSEKSEHSGCCEAVLTADMEKSPSKTENLCFVCRHYLCATLLCLI